jgi:Na+-driven multidrug efflux pump
MNSGFMIISTLLLNIFAIHYGDDVVAGFGITMRLVQVPQFLVMGLFFGAIPLFAYNFSNKNLQRLHDSFKTVCLFIGLIVVCFVSLTYIFRMPILHLFTGQESLLKISENILLANLVTTIFNGFTGATLGLFQGTGKGLPTIIISVIQSIAIVPIIIFMNSIFGLSGLIWSTTITEIVAFIIGFVFYFIYRSDFVEKSEDKPVRVSAH